MWTTLAPFAVQSGSSALLGLVVYFILRGKLIPKSTHDDAIGVRERHITALEATVTEKDKQISILLSELRKPPT